MNFDRCALTGYALFAGDIKSTVGRFIEYETDYVGRVKIPISTYGQLINGKHENYLLAGICKQRTIDNQEPIMLDTAFITEGYKNTNPPSQFEEKCVHLLKHIYENYGKENREFEFNSTKDFALAYASPEEFVRIINQLKQDHFISVRKDHRLAGGARLYMGITMTGIGKDKAKKQLPKMPMFGLVSQEITSGDTAIDLKINEARQRFFSEPQSMENMRSACETLSYVLEPLRKDISTVLPSRDVSDFFLIVNTFDIRHNKDTTKNLIYPEQMEWVFYTLLNSINSYIKLKKIL